MGRCNVLILDPERDMADLLIRAIESRWGSKCYLATREEEGLSLLRDVTFDLVLLDLAAAAANDFHLLRRIKHDHPSVAVVVLSYLHQQDQALESRDLGADILITKPLSVRILRERLDPIFASSCPNCHPSGDRSVS